MPNDDLAWLQEKLECPERGPDGKLYFMLKQKPEVLSVEAMEGAPNQTVRVKDIKSYASRKIVQSMQEGDEVLLYQTVKPNSKEQPGLTGLCCVASAPYPDPTDGKWLAFDLRLEEPFDSEDGAGLHERRSFKGHSSGGAVPCYALLRYANARPWRITLNNMKKYEKAELRGATLFSNQMLQVHWLTPGQFDFLLEIPDEE
ncbi:hypothetical protein COHA_007134 [Chlorella ohadii]|uniref:EVE domain-containing protein n=1 Tax=Chlorella ohadii TaxID=2649997 RepID=A0AAD5DMZ6_9CHLO|nr:hypothetical protein COHA_007134 [Chlorella ohadii]